MTVVFATKAKSMPRTYMAYTRADFNYQILENVPRVALVPYQPQLGKFTWCCR